MRAKHVLAVLCVAAVVGAAAPTAFADVFTGNIGSGTSKVYSLTTDTSTILQITAIAFNERTDLDILVTYRNEDDEDVVLLDSRSGVLQLEQGTVGLEGALEVTITVTNVDGPRSRFVLLMTEPANPGVDKVQSLPIRYAGEFGPDEAVTDPALAGLQRLINERLAGR